MPEFINVLSSREETIREVQRLLKEHGKEAIRTSRSPFSRAHSSQRSLSPLGVSTGFSFSLATAHKYND